MRDNLCDRDKRPRDQELETWCPTDCPIDCEVSDWSSWDSSQCKCGSNQSKMTRVRVKTTEASPTGRPCPAIMSESRPCPSRPCFELLRSSISCDLQGAFCGVGNVIRLTTIVENTINNISHTCYQYYFK